MAKQGGDFGGDVNLGTDAWNVADGYTKLKILRQLSETGDVDIKIGQAIAMLDKIIMAEQDSERPTTARAMHGSLRLPHDVLPTPGNFLTGPDTSGAFFSQQETTQMFKQAA